MTRPVLLDLFCGAGGAAMGYHCAGFDVIGVDIAPQPHYPFEFHQADALVFLSTNLNMNEHPWFDAIHASPVCKLWSPITRTSKHAKDHPDLITPLRPILNRAGVPWVMENVPQAPLVDPIILCGSMFDLDVRRHRGFETNWKLSDHHWPCRHRIWTPRFVPNRSDRKRNPSAARASVMSIAGGGSGGYGGRVDDWRRAMGIDWMTRDELAQAIPPAYTEWIGGQLLAAIEMAAAS